MFIDLHCNWTQTQQRFRGRESTQIQCHERVLYASASRPAALQRHKFSEEGPTRLCLFTRTASKQMLVALQRYKGTSFSEKGQAQIFD